uniref:Uncharacterized protein n=1 Tax=Rhodosorus marinus TaxID=101924 RepID=A0A7S3AAI3_9RHOD
MFSCSFKPLSVSRARARTYWSSRSHLVIFGLDPSMQWCIVLATWPQTLFNRSISHEFAPYELLFDLRAGEKSAVRFSFFRVPAMLKPKGTRKRLALRGTHAGQASRNRNPCIRAEG